METQNYFETDSIYIKNINIIKPSLKIEEPTEINRNNGYYYRYFFRQYNNENGKIYETSESEYNLINKDSIYKTIQIKWMIDGEISNVIQTNIKTIILADKILPNISKILLSNILFNYNKQENIIEIKDIINNIIDISINQIKSANIKNIILYNNITYDENNNVYATDDMGNKLRIQQKIINDKNVTYIERKKRKLQFINNLVGIDRLYTKFNLATEDLYDLLTEDFYELIG